MTVRSLPSLRWPTASSFSAADRGDVHELSLLGAHYRHCNGCRERWFSMRCLADTLNAFIVPRFMTTLVVVAAVGLAGHLVL